MAHFAELDDVNGVVNVITVANEDILDENGNESEEIGIAFCKSLFGEDTNWKQTSYNANFRYNYAIIGGEYDPDVDAFIAFQPFPSWSLNTEDYRWYPPIPRPDVNELPPGTSYSWDEDLYQSDNTQGWVLME